MRPEPATVIAGLYEAAMAPQLWTGALQRLADFTGSRGALIIRTDRGRDGVLCSDSLSDTITQFFDDGWFERDLRTERMLQSPRAGFFCDQQITTAEERRRSDYYNRFARAAGVPWFAACGWTLEDPMRAMGVSIQRTAREGAFLAPDIRRLTRIYPHMENAVAFARRVADREGAERLDSLERVGAAAYAVDHQGVPRRMNGLGEAGMGRFVTTRRRRLTTTDPSQRAALDRLVAAAVAASRAPAAADGAVLAPLRLTDGAGAHALARAIPLQGSARWFGDAAAIVSIVEDADVRGAATELLAAAFDLTPTEARVAHHLSRGLEVDEIAAACGLSAGAVRFHLKSVLPKAGVRRQAAFVARAAALGAL